MKGGLPQGPCVEHCPTRVCGELGHVTTQGRHPGRCGQAKAIEGLTHLAASPLGIRGPAACCVT